MKTIYSFLYEWHHFTRSPFKYIALILFILAGVYGLHNGSMLYNNQQIEINRIHSQVEEEQSKYLDFYKNNEKGPADRPWVDMTTPFWAMWNAYTFKFKTPSPLMVYNVGQAEQFGFYKRVTFLSSPYDADMVEEIANPERLQSGLLDFSFAILFLAPLLLLIFLYNIKGAETDYGIFTLILVQNQNARTWVWSRIAFYFCVTWATIFILMIYGTFLTPVFEYSSAGFWKLLLWVSMYLVFWTVLFGIVLSMGSSTIGNTLKMTALWLAFVFVIPGAVHQWVSATYPANLMTELIDAQRDERDELYSLPDSVFQAKLNTKLPGILKTVVFKDSTKSKRAMNQSASALTNDLTKNGIIAIEQNHKDKNQLIESSYWFNPITYFQNKLNRITKTHFDDYHLYRQQIQNLIDYQIELMVMDIWNDKTIDQNGYLNYIKLLNDYKSPQSK